MKQTKNPIGQKIPKENKKLSKNMESVLCWSITPGYQTWLGEN